MNFSTLPLALLGLGQGELIVIFIVLLLFFGGRKLPELARGLGKSIREFRKATSEVEDDFRRAMEEPPPSGNGSAARPAEGTKPAASPPPAS